MTVQRFSALPGELIGLVEQADTGLRVLFMGEQRFIDSVHEFSRTLAGCSQFFRLRLQLIRLVIGILQVPL